MGRGARATILIGERDGLASYAGKLWQFIGKYYRSSLWHCFVPARYRYGFTTPSAMYPTVTRDSAMLLWTPTAQRTVMGQATFPTGTLIMLPAAPRALVSQAQAQAQKIAPAHCLGIIWEWLAPHPGISQVEVFPTPMTASFVTSFRKPALPAFASKRYPQSMSLLTCPR